MLTSTFVHMNGIGPSAEQMLWNRGVYTWEDFIRDGDRLFSENKTRKLFAQIELSRKSLCDKNMVFFMRSLKSGHRVRILPNLEGKIAYLDIETTGLNRNAEITTIALYDGSRFQTFVRGFNLWDFARNISPYDTIVTFNGARFDLPWIRREFGIDLPQLHIDLCLELRGLGMTGGLKRCEKVLGIKRQHPEELDGFDAVRLWREYQITGDIELLRTLLIYNCQDVLSLETILVQAYNKSMQNCPLDFSKKIPPQPEICVQVDENLRFLTSI